MESIKTELITKHYRYTTEKSYLHWVGIFIRFNNYVPPKDMGNSKIERLLKGL
ncbi:phage integrase N-terminal SAM-like domain-containing protein [Catenovulum adriaticum]|uniref:phage integrase N-terminal SAM-like domain-containing protein n=1 Tax=Catenovulum adriaticum TaxID=2984846 RepID=UPI003D17DD59